MFVFGFAADARGAAAASRRVHAMMEARGGDPDATVVVQAPHAAAGLSRWSVSARDDRAAPIWDDERQWLVTGDVRLHNRAELLGELRADLREPDPSDLALAWLATARWGRDVGRRLVGDFAFVVWNDRTRSAFAVRDHLGVRPLHWHETPEGVVLASDVRQILCLLPSTLDRVDEHKILDRFMKRWRSPERSFFRGISLVRPGHQLEAEAGRFREVRHWFPPESDERTSYADHCEAFRGAFERAVRDRLQSDRPIVAHSSGGYDSSSILLTAERIYAEGARRPPLVMASAISPGMISDESHLMDAVARRVRFEGHRWSVHEPNDADFDDPSLVRPGMGRGPGGGARRDFALARERGARVLLAGHLGDTVMYAWGWRRDLFRRAQWRALARGTFGGHDVGTGARLLLKAAFGALPPAIALSLSERAFGRPGPPPPWFGPRLREIYSTRPSTLGTLARDWPSHFACEVWARLTSAQVGISVDGPVEAAANAGLEMRMPYADVRLIEGILRIPVIHRIRSGGGWTLRRDTLGQIMPSEFAARKAQPSWSPALALAARRRFGRVTQLLREGDWLNAPYCDKREVARWLAELTRMGDAAPARDCVTVADVGAVEAWLRRLLRYDAQPRWRDD